ncbi:hypothetical protein BDD12DRAFT_365961 [Trichophaea hybrida]|nr:hypothetical protein BDD12DRAFT_365961 [Trichophaea hybrida]
MINESTAMDSKVTTRGIQKFETSPELVDMVVKSFAYIDHEITELPDRQNYFNNYKAEKVEMNTWILGNRKITIERFLSTSKKEHYTIKLSSLTLKKLARYIDHEGPETTDHIKAAVFDLNWGAQHIHEMFTLKAEGLILRPKVAPKLAEAASHNAAQPSVSDEEEVDCVNVH